MPLIAMLNKTEFVNALNQTDFQINIWQTPLPSIIMTVGHSVPDSFSFVFTVLG